MGDSDTIALRAHHLLCLHGFRGLGYSEEFVAGMRRVQEALGDGGQRVEVVLGPDVICRPCPHLAERPRCAREDGSERDGAVLAALDVPAGLIRPWRWWQERLAERIPPARFTEICCDCAWYDLGYCLEGMAALQRMRARERGGRRDALRRAQGRLCAPRKERELL